MVNDTITEEEIANNKKSKKQKIPKEISQEILKKMFKNILRAVGIMLYFIVLNLAYTSMKQERLLEDIKIFAGAFLVVGIILLEKAYKKDDMSIAISALEALALSIYSLTIMHVITLFKYDFRLYLLTSSYIISIYYVLKAIILYTKGRREYLRSLSDISEILKKDEPIKKEAKKRINNENNNEQVKASDTKRKTTNSKTKKSSKTTSKRTNNTNSNKKTENTTTNKKNNSTTKRKKQTSTKTKKTEKEETSAVVEKKKRGRPKKEVTKND